MSYANKQAKKFGKKIGNAAKRRYFKGGKPSLRNTKIVQIAKDVNMLKNMVNAEKHRITTSGTYQFAETGPSALSSGYYVQRELFLAPQNITNTGRVGNSIKCHSYHMDLRFTQQSSATNEIRGKVYLISIRDPQTVISNTDIITKFLQPSVFDNKYDYHSPRNYENYTDFKILSQKNIFLPADSISGHVATRNVTMGGKLNFHQRYKVSPQAHSVFDTNELAIIFVADSGDLAASNGISVQYSGTMYFYDN